MPISDSSDYEEGHFSRVYDHIIKPAVTNAGFEPLRADEVKQTNVIVIDILKRIINSDMALCDLSGKNPNVLYELGIRQAFDLPVTLIKDERTKRIFDIQGFRDFEYNSNLRIDEVNTAIEGLSEIIQNTFEQKETDVNSIIDLLKINKAQISGEINLSPETNLILQQLQDLRFDFNKLKELTESTITRAPKQVNKNQNNDDHPRLATNDGKLFIGNMVEHPKFGVGVVESIKSSGNNEVVTVNFKNSGLRMLLYAFAKLKIIDTPGKKTSSS